MIDWLICWGCSVEKHPKTLIRPSGDGLAMTARDLGALNLSFLF